SLPRAVVLRAADAELGLRSILGRFGRTLPTLDRSIRTAEHRLHRDGPAPPAPGDRPRALSAPSTGVPMGMSRTRPLAIVALVMTPLALIAVGVASPDDSRPST